MPVLRIAWLDRSQTVSSTLGGALPPTVILITLAFLLPVETLLPAVHQFRISETAVALLWLYTLAMRGAFPAQASLRLAVVGGVAAVLVASPFAALPGHAIDTGLLEVGMAFALLHIFYAWGDERLFEQCMVAFILGVMALSLYQIVALYPAYRSGWPPILPADFMWVKNNRAIVQRVLPIGNSDNYATLWALAFPMTIGLAGIVKPRWPLILAAAIIGYCGLLLYSRAGILVCALALAGFALLNLVSRTRANLTAVIGAATLVAMIAAPGALGYFAQGITSYSHASLGNSSQVAVTATSGAERATAARRGVATAVSHWPMGIGYGMYPRVDPVLTSPHSQLLLWAAEGGVPGLASIIGLCVFLAGALVCAVRAGAVGIGTVAAVSAASMMAKSVVFGGNFTVSSNFVWGFGFALCLAAAARDNREMAASMPWRASAMVILVSSMAWLPAKVVVFATSHPPRYCVARDGEVKQCGWLP